MTDSAWDFLVDRKDLRSTTFEPSAVHEQFARDGGTLLKVDRFALTANNVSCAVAGDAMGYWGFFPARNGMGRIPVWGFADVIASTNPALQPGERLYGYLPMSTHVIIQPDRVTRGGLIDAAAHRTV